MKKLFAILLATFLVGCASIPRPTTIAQVGAPPYDAWARVLEKFVDDQGRVNFAAVAKDRGDLDQFVAYVYDVGPNNHPELFPTPQHVLAYHINAYNALAMHKVVVTGIPTSFSGVKKVGFFYLGKVQVGGQPISLYDYENKIIRALGDPRIHVALNCMSVSCPCLPRDVFTPGKVDAQLDREARWFYSEPRNVRIDNVKKVVMLSEILKFYTEDFLAKAPSLTAYVNRYRIDTPNVPDDFKIEFADYDWTVNRQPGT